MPCLRSVLEMSSSARASPSWPIPVRSRFSEARSYDLCVWLKRTNELIIAKYEGRTHQMKRLTLLLLLATTAMCYGQSSEEITNSTGSSDMPADSVVTESNYIDALEQLDRQRNEESRRHFDAITRDEEIETLKQQDNTLYSPIQPKYNRTKNNQQHGRSSTSGQHLPDKYITSHHTMAPAPLHNSSKNDYHRPSTSSVHQPPK